MSFKAKPRSIKDIREKAELIRTVTEMAMDTKTEQFPILHFAEIIIPQIAEDFTFVIGSKEEMGNNLGLTDIKEKTFILDSQGLLYGPAEKLSRFLSVPASLRHPGTPPLFAVLSLLPFQIILLRIIVLSGRAAVNFIRIIL